MPPTLSSNGVAVPFDDRHFAPLTDSTALLDDPAALRRRYAEDGYLFLRGVLDRDLVWDLRRAYFSLFDPSYLRPGSAPAEGCFSGHRPAHLPPHGVAGHPAYAFVRGADFERLASHPALRRLAEEVLGGPARRLPRSIVRHFDRAEPRASRAHLDYDYLDAGSDQLVTVWIPLGACPLQTGGLVYLEGSHRVPPGDLAGLRRVTDRPGDARPLSHDLGWVSEQLGRRWRWADYQAGDLTLHSPHLVHASLDTLTDTMRLSADVRFLRDGELADHRWLAPWAGDDGN